MAIRVERGTVERILDAAGGFAVQVQHPENLGAAIAALKLARVDLLGLASSCREVSGEPSGTRPAPRTSVSPVVSVPGGPMLLVEHLDTEYDQLRSIPDVVAQRLEKAGLEHATIAVPRPGGVLDDLDLVAHAAVLRLFPEPAGTATALPAEWLDIACEWVTGDLDEGAMVRMRVLSIEFDVPAHDVPAVMHECGLAKTWCDAVIGSLDDRIRTASLTFGRLPHLALAAGGPNVDSTGLLARYRLLQDVAREVTTDLAYACIDLEPTFEGLALGLSPVGWQTEGGAPPNRVAHELVDEWVPDAYPYQVLGPGHLARLKGVELDAGELAGGRVEVAIGEAGSWLPDTEAREEIQAQGWELLRPCLALEDELAALAEMRTKSRSRAKAVRSTDTTTVSDAELASLPTVRDLGAIVLEPEPHSRRGTRLTLLELVSWLDHEPHSDAPSGVSQVLATFARWWASGLSDGDRQDLKAIAPRLLGTAGSSDDHEQKRRWLATEWLVRVQAPAWLRAAGMLEVADRLIGLGSLRDDLELVRAVDTLGSAITVASRRLDITTSIVSDDEAHSAVAEDQLVWDAWERVAESTGWVAASETATHGAPAELAFATDLRVIECSRDARTRAELEAGRRSIGDSAWTTALHSIADEAWDRGWRAADLAARELSGFTLRVEMGRVAKTVLELGRLDDDGPETALEAAERAARDSLTRAALQGGADPNGNGEHPWDAARNAARVSSGGKEWSIVLDEARRAVGESAWAQAMADARAVTMALLETAPDTVARVVVASVAREAASAAGRGVAVRAAAIARANGSDDETTAAAVDDAMDQIASALQAEALTLLENLITPP
ncbi:MAG: hypothetical protein QOJ67_313 [Acidimicrobiaceae bacterium]